MLTKLSAILDVSSEIGCMTLAGMIGVILAAVKSSIFLATATVSTLLKGKGIDQTLKISDRSFIFLS